MKFGLYIACGIERAVLVASMARQLAIRMDTSDICHSILRHRGPNPDVQCGITKPMDVLLKRHTCAGSPLVYFVYGGRLIA